MLFSTSIFDTQNQDHHLWHKEHPEFDSAAEIKFSSVAYKPKNKARKLAKRQFFIKGNFLCYRKKSRNEQISGVMDLRWVRVSFEEEEECLEAKCPYFVRLVHEEKFTSIHFKTLEEVSSWREALKEVAVMTDFHLRYEAVKQIGKGSYARVSC